MTIIEVHTEINATIEGDEVISVGIDLKTITLREGDSRVYLTHAQFHELSEFYNKFNAARLAIGAA